MINATITYYGKRERTEEVLCINRDDVMLTAKALSCDDDIDCSIVMHDRLTGALIDMTDQTFKGLPLEDFVDDQKYQEILNGQ